MGCQFRSITIQGGIGSELQQDFHDIQGLLIFIYYFFQYLQITMFKATHYILPQKT